MRALLILAALGAAASPALIAPAQATCIGFCGPYDPPTDLVVVAYKQFQFGRWYAINAEGQQLGPILSKKEAEALAEADDVPLIGMSQSKP